MSVMVGDPLYRPYASWLQTDAQTRSAKNASDWKMYHEFAVKSAARPAAEFRALAGKAAVSARNCPMLEDVGSIEARDGNRSVAANYFQQACTCYTKPDDIVRVVLEESDALLKLNKAERALDLVSKTLRNFPNSSAAPLLKNIEREAISQQSVTPTPKP
jgi:tetratricopeptide (TPR) repeat protein